MLFFFLFEFLSTKETNENIEAPQQQLQSISTPPKESVAVPLQEQNQTTLDENATVKEDNSTVSKQQVMQKEEKNETSQTSLVSQKKQNSQLRIMPKSKVWFGYIDLQTNEKFQATFLDEFLLDASKEWLLAFGHGNISIEINGVSHEFKTHKNMRFLYKNGVLKEIDVEEYKVLNGGKAW